jgi:hypothetical protein
LEPATRNNHAGILPALALGSQHDRFANFGERYSCFAHRADESRPMVDGKDGIEILGRVKPANDPGISIARL